ncbi:hypothetical protein AAG570_003346 [Ranatra chinensis]|uniref:Uncharacterized protein n=1 Tax=Ranatra chinensis TaxID=642074 RepID=A0ABD0Y3E7_9HEMI
MVLYGTILLASFYKSGVFSFVRQTTLAILDKLDIDSEKPTEEEVARTFGYEEDFLAGRLTAWQKVKPKVWSMFDEPYSSIGAKVSTQHFVLLPTNHVGGCGKKHREDASRPAAFTGALPQFAPLSLYFQRMGLVFTAQTHYRAFRLNWERVVSLHATLRGKNGREEGYQEKETERDG